MWFDILALLSLLAVITLLRRLVNIFPSLMASMIRWKENINLQASLKMRTDRDLVSLALFIPFCLTAFRYRMYCPSFLNGLDAGSQLWVTIGIFAAYVSLRGLCRIILHMKSSVAGKAANECSRTYFIILTILLVATGGILSLFNTPPTGIRAAMFWISGTIYAIFLLRKAQIFLSYCNIFASFLYLCALEILPTGVLIASAVVF